MKLLSLILDIVLISCADLIAYWLRFKGIPVKMDVPIFQFWPFFLLIRIFWLYAKSSYRIHFTNLVDIFIHFLKNITFTAFIIIAIAHFNSNLTFSRLVMIYSWFISIILLSIGRMILFLLFDQSKLVKSVIIAGDNESIRRVLNEIRDSKKSEWKIKGVIAEKQSPFDVPFLATLKNFHSFPHRFKADMVVLAVDNMPELERLKLITDIKKGKMDYLIIPDFYELITSNIGTSDILGRPVLEPIKEPFRPESRLIKRIFDICFSLAAIVMLSPVYLLAGVMVFFTMGFPIIFKQIRIGKNLKPFKIYKFRTMVKDAHRKGPKLTKKGDSRITALGRIFREKSIDELPQFINILKGDMSVVGPRPEIPDIVKNYNEWQKEVLKVRPGLTGLAQINGRQNLSIPVKLKMDIYYIQNYSIALDIRIIIKTIFSIFNPNGAF